MFEFHPSSFDRLAYNSGDAVLQPISFRSHVTPPAGSTQAIWQAIVKRTLDLVLAFALLAVFAIPMLVLGIMVRRSSDGPALFRQERIGLNGRRFVMVKFRTMYHATQSAAKCCQATRGDPRVTRVGAFLRRTSLDELPQLLNVLAGSMSMVGPRPHAPGTCAAGRPFEHVTRRYAGRHSVKPGITGLAQVRGWRGETDTEEKLLHRLDCDLEYIAIRSIGVDLLILCRTVLAVARMLNAY
jgi:lipopolysaccharide/colanic/teichoic acid biosynthesis glycosyltransferase